MRHLQSPHTADLLWRAKPIYELNQFPSLDFYHVSVSATGYPFCDWAQNLKMLQKAKVENLYFCMSILIQNLYQYSSLCTNCTNMYPNQCVLKLNVRVILI